MPSQSGRSSRSGARSNHRSTLSIQKTEIKINVYDLLQVRPPLPRRTAPGVSCAGPAPSEPAIPSSAREHLELTNPRLEQPGKLSSFLWTVGSSLLHTGVVINGKEYAYGGHGRPGLSGVYWTKPGQVPPGALFQCEIIHGYTFASEAEIDATIRDVSGEFLGPSYNLVSNNCNHFTSHLVERLTGMPGPAWLNRAARIGMAFPCVVPREWLQPPAADIADGELVEEEVEDQEDESSHMLPRKAQRTAPN
jgi:hypothetical protein